MAARTHRNRRARDRRRNRHMALVRYRGDDALYDEARLDPQTHAGQVAGAPGSPRGGGLRARLRAWVRRLWVG